jgi:hypothetical protein
LGRPFIGATFRIPRPGVFFGRDGELHMLELQVKQNRFVALVGRSGCGKSSLISAGLRPRLENVPDHRWCWIEIRPGDAPIRELALGLAGLTGEAGDLSEAWADRFERILFSAAVLQRKAVVYVRQSTLQQVQSNLESQRRQYELVEVARRRGFTDIDVIDDDLGRSASGTVERPGFDRLVAALCAGQVGAVLCLDDSRLARHGRDWHHLWADTGRIRHQGR